MHRERTLQAPPRCSARTATWGNANASSSGFFDREYYDEIITTPFREGTIAEAPVLPGSGLFMPGGTGAMKDKGLFRREVPHFDPDLCTGCMECTLVCPDAAIPNTVHEIHEVLATAAAAIDTDSAILKRNFGRVAEILATLPVAKTRPFFDAMEKNKPAK